MVLYYYGRKGKDMNNLSENIRKYRKESGMTQEELAENLGVTFGTVSKWERGASEPDVDYIMDMAELFHISVDVLIGYVMRGESLSTILEKIRKYRNEKKIIQASLEADEALKKYPNNLNLVYNAAEVYKLCWMQTKNADEINKAYKCYTHALSLLPSDNPEINEMSINNLIAACFIAMKKYDDALDILKRNNTQGVNDTMIASILIAEYDNEKEASVYADKAFVKLAGQMFETLNVYVSVFLRKNADEAIRACDFIIGFLNLLRKDKDKPFFFDKFIPMAYFLKGIGEIQKKRTNEGKKLFNRAYKEAVKFDKSPSGDLKNFIFVSEGTKDAVYDNVKESALQSIDYILDNTEHNVDIKTVKKIWNEVKNENKRSKT